MVLQNSKLRNKSLSSQRKFNMMFWNNFLKWKIQIKITNFGWKNWRLNERKENREMSILNMSIPYQNKTSSINAFTSPWLDSRRFTLIISWKQLNISKHIFLKTSMWRVQSASFTQCLFITLCCKQGKTRRMLLSSVRKYLFI